ncbi:MAG: isoprenylcysteine carboxylmethyltransferase family protein [Planctomycetota bacterium]
MNKWSLEKTLDLIEQIVITILYTLLVVRLWPRDFSNPQSWFSMLLVASEGIVVAFVLVRRSASKISHRALDWIIAFAGTVFSLLVIPGGPPILGSTGPFLILAGILLHVGAKLSLRRSFGLVAADRGVKATGMYCLVRHPMYLGYILSHLGYLLIAPGWWNLSVYALGWSFLVARIFAEERILKSNPAYRAYMEKVPYRLILFLF